MILAVAVLSLIFSSVNAQAIVGIKGGVSSGQLSGFSGNSRVSGHAGLFLHHQINSNWCFQPELIYSGEGQRYFTDGNERTIALDYISVPLMIQYYPVRQIYFEAGPQVGILASAQDKGDGTQNINVKGDYSTAQVGLNVGVGVNVTSNVGFYGRYQFGLTDVSKFDNIVDHSQVGQIGVAIRLK